MKSLMALTCPGRVAVEQTKYRSTPISFPLSSRDSAVPWPLPRMGWS